MPELQEARRVAEEVRLEPQSPAEAQADHQVVEFQTQPGVMAHLGLDTPSEIK